MIRKCHDDSFELCDWIQRPSLYEEDPPVLDHERVMDEEEKEIEHRLTHDNFDLQDRQPLFDDIKLKGIPILDERGWTDTTQT